MMPNYKLYSGFYILNFKIIERCLKWEFLVDLG